MQSSLVKLEAKSKISDLDTKEVLLFCMSRC